MPDACLPGAGESTLAWLGLIDSLRAARDRTAADITRRPGRAGIHTRKGRGREGQQKWVDVGGVGLRGFWRGLATVPKRLKAGGKEQTGRAPAGRRQARARVAIGQEAWEDRGLAGRTRKINDVEEAGWDDRHDNDDQRAQPRESPAAQTTRPGGARHRDKTRSGGACDQVAAARGARASGVDRSRGCGECRPTMAVGRCAGMQRKVTARPGGCETL